MSGCWLGAGVWSLGETSAGDRNFRVISIRLIFKAMTLNEIMKGVVVEGKQKRSKPEPQGTPKLSSEADGSVIARSRFVVIVSLCLTLPYTTISLMERTGSYSIFLTVLSEVRFTYRNTPLF